MNKAQVLRELVEAVGTFRAAKNPFGGAYADLVQKHIAYLAAKDEKCPACDYNRTAPTPYFFCTL